MNHSISRRALVRIVSFLAALIAALTVTSLRGYTQAEQRGTLLEQSYQRSLAQLTEYLGNLETTLNKGKYAASAYQMRRLSEQLLQQAGYAKLALEQLPLSGDEVSATNKFLSQVGNFCYALSENASAGTRATEEEMSAVRTLAEYARALLDKLCALEAAVDSGNLQLGTAQNAVRTSDLSEDMSLTDSFRELEDGFAEYPTLLYDGPFSDVVPNGDAAMLNGREYLSAAEAQSAAAKFAAGNWTETIGIDSDLPCYRFTDGDRSITVTRTGGLVRAFIDARPLGAAALTVEQALQRGEELMRTFGYDNMVVRYYTLSNGVLTINFAATEEGVVLYPDLIKLGVAMDNGDAVRFDATGYLLHHTKRNLPAPALTAAEAETKLSDILTPIGNVRTVLIPTDGGGEQLCYEFLCEGEGEQVLVYIHAQSGEEQQIMILMKDETGVLVM